LKPLLQEAADHDDAERAEGDGAREAVRLLNVARDEDDLVGGATVRGAAGVVLDERAEPKFRDELIDEDDDADGADETTEEGTGEDAVEEAEPTKTRDEDDGSCHAGHDARDFGVAFAVCVGVPAAADVFADDLAGEKGAGGFGADNHLRAGT